MESREACTISRVKVYKPHSSVHGSHRFSQIGLVATIYPASDLPTQFTIPLAIIENEN